MIPHKIELTPEHHYYIDGFRVPGVSEVINDNKISDYSAVKSEILEVAADFGKKVHKTCEYFDKGILIETTLDPALKPYLEGWKKFKEDYSFKIISIESILGSKKYGFGGTLDRAGIINRGQYDGALCIVDIKTVVSLNKKSTAMQLDGYKILWNENNKNKATKKLAVQLYEYGYKLHDLSQPQNNGIFIHAISLTNWRKLK